MTEEVLIDLKVQQNEDAFAKLAHLKSSIVGLKQEQVALAKALKDESITRQEYAKEVVRVDAMLKKHTDTYNNLQKKVTGVKSPMDKLTASISEQSKQVNVAGVSLASFANPVTATVAILGGLFTAYKNTTIGAKDLEFASNQLSAATTILGNDLASLFSSAEDGEGFFSTMTHGFLNYFSPSLAATSKGLALMQEQLEDLHREELKVQAANSDRLKENAELNELMADGTVSLDEKRRAAVKSVTNLRINESELLRVKEAELKILERKFAADSKNEALEDAVLMKTAEIATIKKDTERAVSKIDKLESNILDTENKKLDSITKQRDAKQKTLDEAEKKRQKEEQDKGLMAEMERLDEINQLRISNEETANAEARERELTATQEHNQRMEEEAINQFNKEKARGELKTAMYARIAQDSVNAFSQYIKTSNDFASGLFKGLLASLLRSLKTYLEFSIIGQSLASADSIATFGISGLIKAAAITALLEGAFAVAESALLGFAQGGKLVSGTRVMPEHGVPITRANGDNRLVTMRVNEAVLTEAQQHRLGGPRAMAAAGVPGFSMGGRGVSLPASGGFVGRELVDVLRASQKVLVIEEVERALSERVAIRNLAKA